MNNTEIARLDLNLLRVFVALAERGSVTGASESLNLAQSTVSHALGRLRAAFDDPLFVRSSHGMQPTEFARVVAPEIRDALEHIQTVVENHRIFVPATSHRSFTLLLTDAGEMLFIPPLIAALRKNAPNVRIIVNHLPREEYRIALEQRQADIAIGQLPAGQSELQQQLLSREPFEGYARVGHPILKNPTLGAFMAADHLIVGKPAMSEVHLQRALGPLAPKRRVALELRHFLPAAFVLAQTDLVALLPRTVSQFIDSFGTLARFPPPVEIEPLTIRQFWHARSDNDPGCQWLRKQIAGIFQRRE